MKTIVVCATIFCLELVSSYPFPEPLPGYYGSYEQVPQQITIPNIARSPDHQQQLAYIQQQNENIRRQHYENALRNQNLNQRLLQRPSYKTQPLLTTVREPYVNSIPLQPIQQAHYEAPKTGQYYPVQNVQSVQSIAQYQPVQSQQYEETRSEANSETESQSQHNDNPYPHQLYPRYNAQNMQYNPRIQQVLASTPLKKRYLVLHPNGTIEHIDKIEDIVEQHPNYILYNAGSVTPKPNVPIVAPSVPVVPAIATAQENTVPVSPTSAPVPQVAPIAPIASSAAVVPNAAPESPVTPAPVAPLAPFVPATAAGQANPDLASPTPVPATLAAVPASPTPATDVPQPNADPASSLTSAPGPAPVNGSPVAPFAPALPPYAPVPASTIQNGRVPGSKPTVPPPTGPTTDLPPVSAPMAQPPVFLNDTVLGPQPIVPPTGPTTALPPVSAQKAQPPVILNDTVTDPTTVPPTVTPSTQPPIWVTATTIPPPTVTPLTPVAPTVDPVTPVSTATPISPVTAIATPAPAVTASPVNATEEPDTPTTVAPYTKPCDPNTDLDVLHLNNGAEPVVWFRTKDLDFWNILTNGNETYNVVYFYNIPREPRMTKEVKTTIHADGTVVEEITQTIIDDIDETPPRVIKTTKVTKPDGTQLKT